MSRHSAMSTRAEEEAGEQYDKQQNEKELARTQRELRDRGREHALYWDAMNKRFTRDQKEMALLEKENEELQLTLSNAVADCHVKRDESTLVVLHGKLDESHVVLDEISAERRRHEDRNVEISQMEKKIKDYRRQMAALKGGNIKKRIVITEGRLDKTTKEFSKMVETNKKKREEIESLRIEQKKYMAMRTKMTAELERLKDEVFEEEEVCKDAFKQREDLVVKRRALAEREEKEQLDYETERENLQRTITADTLFREFVEEKSKSIGHRQVEAEQARIVKERTNRIRSAQNRIDEFEAAFKRITKVTQEDDPDVIVAQFLKFDAEMFSMFTYSAEAESQVGKLEYEIQSIKDEQLATQDKFATLELDRKLRLHQLDEQLRQTQEGKVKVEEQLAKTLKQMAELVERTQESHSRLSAKDNVLKKLLEGEALTSRNALIYLAELERRTHKLLLFYDLKKEKEKEGNVSKKEDGQEDSGEKDAKADRIVVNSLEDLLPPESPIRVIEDTPDYKSGSESSDDENADVVPLTEDEIKRKILGKI